MANDLNTPLCFLMYDSLPMMAHEAYILHITQKDPSTHTTTVKIKYRIYAQQAMIAMVLFTNYWAIA